MGVTRYVNMAFVAAGLIAWVVFSDLFRWGIELVGTAYNSQIIGHNFRVADFLGLLIAFAFTVYCRRDDKIYTFALESGNELAKVTWPSYSETRLATIVTIIVTIIIAMILEGFDYIWAALSSFVYDV